jgi:hypothetical protein
MMLRAGLTGTKFTKRNIGRYGSRNAALRANRRMKALSQVPVGILAVDSAVGLKQIRFNAYRNSTVGKIEAAKTQTSAEFNKHQAKPATC